MRAVAYNQFGAPEVLQVMDLPEPKPGAGEAVVRVRASTVNPVDLLNRSGGFAAVMADIEPPYVCGVEFSGHVHALGAGVSGLTVGQPVIGIVNARRQGGGAHAEYVCVPAASLAPAPAGVDLEAAATIPMNGLTAKMCLEALALAPGGTLLVTGGAGAVGGYVIQLAKKAGLTVVADAKESDVPILRELGVDHAVPRGEGLVAAVRALYPQGVDGLVDAAILTDRVAPAVRDGGRAATLRRTDVISDPRIQSHVIAVFNQATNTEALTALSKAAETGALTLRVTRKLDMTQAAEAHRLVGAGGMRGRVVLTF
ncbi:MAG: NADP-dependent oxidoreductase [Alphaproteobacteria bacterium]